MCAYARRVGQSRASIGSTDAAGKSFRGSMASMRLSPSIRERLREQRDAGFGEDAKDGQLI